MAVNVPMHNGISQVAEPWALAEVLPFPFMRQLKENGYGGSGIQFEDFVTMWPVPVFAVLWLACRFLMKNYMLPRVAVALGCNPRRKSAIRKFGYQGWLTTYYAASAVFGWFFVLRHEKFGIFPLNVEAGRAMVDFTPAPIKDNIRFYYWFQLGFYISELYSLMVEPRRSDFMEYLVHHVTTMFLVGLSYVGRQHRIGSYVFFLHDVTDIFLGSAKMLHYCSRRWEPVVNCLFGLFVASFAFLRLYCFPHVSWVLFAISPALTPVYVSFWALTYALAVILQSLHVMWFYMILRLLYRMVTGGLSDPRSDDEDDGTTAAFKKDEMKTK